jgi:hypothetical protein
LFIAVGFCPRAQPAAGVEWGKVRSTLLFLSREGFLLRRSKLLDGSVELDVPLLTMRL